MGKVFICLDLEWFFLEFSKGSWELYTCHHLVDGLNGALSESAFSGTWSHRLIPAVRLWRLQHVSVMCFLSPLAVGVWGVVCQLSSYNVYVRLALLPSLVVGSFKAKSANYCSGWWYNQGATSLLAMVAWRHLLQVQISAAASWLGRSSWLLSARLRIWSAIPQRWLLGQNCFSGLSSSIWGILRQAHC